MRGMIDGADLARYAGQFVWLELNFDRAENRAFLTKYGAIATPTFYIIDAQSARVSATQTGAMSLPEFKQFLERGASGISVKARTPADEALTRGDSLLARQPLEAVKAYQEALRDSPPSWPHRDLAEASLVTAMQNSGDYRQCAETAANEAASMNRSEMFGRTVVVGMWCVVNGDPAPWSKDLAAKLEPLAREGLSLPATVRDHRNELYRTLMYVALARNDQAQAKDWGDRWLKELDAIRPASDEERSAVDIARVENIQAFGDPKRILPALLTSEQAMPHSWNASLRVAQMEIAAQSYADAIRACDRGLARVPGPAGRSWILQTKAEALNHLGQPQQARQAFAEALTAAASIPNERTRQNNIHKIAQALKQLPNR